MDRESRMACCTAAREVQGEQGDVILGKVYRSINGVYYATMRQWPRSNLIVGESCLRSDQQRWRRSKNVTVKGLVDNNKRAGERSQNQRSEGTVVRPVVVGDFGWAQRRVASTTTTWSTIARRPSCRMLGAGATLQSVCLRKGITSK
jgi:hypothetical protein